jgi:hypothetical protein
MSNISNPTTRLSWLAAKLGSERDRALQLIIRMRGMLTAGALAAMKPAKFHKFMSLMDEVASARDEERLILSRIDAIEAHHKRKRKGRQLRRAAPRPAEDTMLELIPEPLKPQKDGFWWLVVLWYMLSRSKMNDKKQQLTYD